MWGGSKANRGGFLKQLILGWLPRAVEFTRLGSEMLKMDPAGLIYVAEALLDSGGSGAENAVLRRHARKSNDSKLLSILIVVIRFES